MSEFSVDTNTIILHFFKFTSSALLSYLAMKWILKQIDSIQDESSKAIAQEKLKKIGVNIGNNLNKYELRIAANLLIPSDIQFSWKHIAGLNHVKDEIFRTVIFPMKNRHLFKDSELTRPPKGILLHGPPGCGKTLIAKATAKEADVRFINLDVSNLTDKWYGESSKLTTALFSLAEKIQPCIIFIDEIDSLLRSRTSNDHEATAQLKAIFMSKWDGLSTNKDCDIIIMGATNRADEIDVAIRRRMPKVFFISLPNKEQRMETIKLILEPELHTLSSKEIEKLAELTEGFSGNDLEELCREASGLRLQEISSQSLDENGKVGRLRNMTMLDCLSVARKMKEMKDMLRPL